MRSTGCGDLAVDSYKRCIDAFVVVEKHLLVRQSVFTSARMRGPVGYRLDSQPEAEVDRLFGLLRTAVG